MAFEIYLPQSRIEASRGLWPDRLPIDDLDAAVRTAPERTAFVGWNSALGREIRLTYAELGERVDRIAAGLVDSASAAATWSPSSCRTGGSSSRCSSPATASAPSPIR